MLFRSTAGNTDIGSLKISTNANHALASVGAVNVGAANINDVAINSSIFEGGVASGLISVGSIWVTENAVINAVATDSMAALGAVTVGNAVFDNLNILALQVGNAPSSITNTELAGAVGLVNLSNLAANSASIVASGETEAVGLINLIDSAYGTLEVSAEAAKVAVGALNVNEINVASMKLKAEATGVDSAAIGFANLNVDYNSLNLGSEGTIAEVAGNLSEKIAEQYYDPGSTFWNKLHDLIDKRDILLDDTKSVNVPLLGADGSIDFDHGEVIPEKQTFNEVLVNYLEQNLGLDWETQLGIDASKDNIVDVLLNLNTEADYDVFLQGILDPLIAALQETADNIAASQGNTFINNLTVDAIGTKASVGVLTAKLGDNGNTQLMGNTVITASGANDSSHNIAVYATRMEGDIAITRDSSTNAVEKVKFTLTPKYDQSDAVTLGINADLSGSAQITGNIISVDGAHVAVGLSDANSFISGDLVATPTIFATDFADTINEKIGELISKADGAVTSLLDKVPDRVLNTLEGLGDPVETLVEIAQAEHEVVVEESIVGGKIHIIADNSAQITGGAIQSYNGGIDINLHNRSVWNVNWQSKFDEGEPQFNLVENLNLKDGYVNLTGGNITIGSDGSVSSKADKTNSIHLAVKNLSIDGKGTAVMNFDNDFLSTDDNGNLTINPDKIGGILIIDKYDDKELGNANEDNWADPTNLIADRTNDVYQSSQKLNLVLNGVSREQFGSMEDMHTAAGLAAMKVIAMPEAWKYAINDSDS